MSSIRRVPNQTTFHSNEGRDSLLERKGQKAIFFNCTLKCTMFGHTDKLRLLGCRPLFSEQVNMSCFAASPGSDVSQCHMFLRVRNRKGPKLHNLSVAVAFSSESHFANFSPLSASATTLRTVIIQKMCTNRL